MMMKQTHRVLKIPWYLFLLTLLIGFGACRKRNVECLNSGSEIRNLALHFEVHDIQDASINLIGLHNRFDENKIQVYDDKFQKPTGFKVTNTGGVNFYVFQSTNYPQEVTDSEQQRIFYLEFPNRDIDTIQLIYNASWSKQDQSQYCPANLQMNYVSLIYNDSTYIDKALFLKKTIFLKKE